MHINVLVQGCKKASSLAIYLQCFAQSDGFKSFREMIAVQIIHDRELFQFQSCNFFLGDLMFQSGSSTMCSFLIEIISKCY